MADQLPFDPTDLPLAPPVGAVVLVDGPTLDTPAAAIVTGPAAAGDGAVTVTAFPPMAGPRPITPVFPDGYPGEGYRYAWPEMVAITGDPTGTDPADGPDMGGDPPADAGQDPAAPGS